MNIEEIDARNFWCPFSRVERPYFSTQYDQQGKSIPVGGITSVNRDSSGGGNFYDSHCLGSRCMAWRWLENKTPLDQSRYAPTRGYCGLAGRPELLKED